MRKPTFFISSTIFDFRDLRSAIKFFLEEQGCIVLASEYNDFDKPLDRHSYDACLESIHDADYFILLIGSRVGGWYEAAKRISITQREYREAYDQHLAGKLKILTLVRAEIWQMKEERRELAKFVQTSNIDEASKSAISNHPSRFAADAEFIQGFLKEVGRIEETKMAIRNGTALPTGNWIHTFTTFRDVMDVLRGQLFTSLPVEQLTARRLLQKELEVIIGELLVKVEDRVYSPRKTVDDFHLAHPITLEGRENQSTEVSAALWDRLSYFSIHILARPIQIIVLPQILADGTFLEFDAANGAYKETVVFSALTRLYSEIRRYNAALEAKALEVVFEHTPAVRQVKKAPVFIDTMKLASLLNLMDRWCNVLELATHVARFLRGKPFASPRLRPDSPIMGMQEGLEAERVSVEEVEGWLR